ncbi:Nif3-like dinuclear metal center hexameric protein [Demequina aurantiaca]|uniref:Nif3-like dinuclear metal center hexameric protein n=1 Tax=Demequina aurantiaca TaxID=676200 RepID=UPI00078197E5|nr:Nif3-like dinuclear metal center hexameric protein [Demequina aurantiaca]
MATVKDVVEVLERMFPPATAEDWDVNGLAVGDRSALVTRVHFAVDPTLAVIDEAIAAGADMLVTHHPLMLRGVTSVAADTSKGSVVHRLIQGGCALYNAHTNADIAHGGVADALAAALGVVDASPLVPSADDASIGPGRIGRLETPMPLQAFADRVAVALPRTAHGVRIAGDLEADVETVAVMGGSGDSYLDVVRASGADVYVTADLRHHPASDARERAELSGGKPFLVDVAHFASEWSWLAATAERVADATGTDTFVSKLNTDPWTARAGA